MTDVINGTESNQVEGQGGFTLIEIVITLVVLSIAAAGVLSVFAVGIKGSANPLVLSQAYELAQGEMDEILGEKANANGFNALGAGNSLPCVSTGSSPAGFTCIRKIYYVSPTDLQTQVGGPTNYKHVTVTITQASIGSINVDSVVTDY